MFLAEKVRAASADNTYFNKLHQAVGLHLNNPVILAEFRVLGLVSKLLFHPWFKLIHDEPHILSLNGKYEQLTQDLADLLRDPTPFLDGSWVGLADYPPTRDAVFLSLVEPSECNLSSECHSL